MRLRNALAASTAAAVPIVLLAGSAQAAQPFRGDYYVGDVVSVKNTAGRVVLTDGTVLKYDKDDRVIFQHYYDDFEYADSGGGCSLRDAGSGELAELATVLGLQTDVHAYNQGSKQDRSLFFLTDTCDGVIDAADTAELH